MLRDVMSQLSALCPAATSEQLNPLDSDILAVSVEQRRR